MPHRPLPAASSRLNYARIFALTGAALLAAALPARADDETPAGKSPWPPAAERALERMTVPDGFTKRIWAAEPLVMDPVAFCFDPAGNIYVAETFRQEHGVEDNRSSSYWLLDDLSLQTLEDRRFMYEKWRERREGGMAYYSEKEDRVRRVSDTDGDGRGDAVTIFSDGYRDPLDGTGSGVLHVDGALYYTNIPSLIRLPDAGGDGHADAKEILSTGYGIRTALRGHDMHGLVLGPDRRLYWSIGDRGYHVEKPDGTVLHRPETGAVFRCELDGSDLTVIHTGLRNPQELAFDDHGNLFTVDNNSDGGDRARVVQIVRGGETGWQMEYQTLEGDNRRGPWNQERLWWTAHEGQPAWIIPPIAHLTSGPSGFTHDLGWSLPDRYRDHFFICDFVGGRAGSCVRSFALEEEGAGFRLVDDHVFVGSVLCTDVDFAPDGRMMISDWGAGWVHNGQGRLLEVADPERVPSTLSEQVATILRDGFDRPVIELVTLIGHVDRRVRFGAQWAIAELGEAGERTLATLFQRGTPTIQRHALWGLGQCGRAGLLGRDGISALIGGTAAANPSVRAVACQVIGEIVEAQGAEVFSLAAFDAVVGCLQDPSGRVVARAAEAIGFIGASEGIAPLLAAASRAADRDPTLRSIIASALAAIGDFEGMLSLLGGDEEPLDPAARRAILLSLRKGGDPRITHFLRDADASLVTEAARAIHDVPIADALPALAGLAPTLLTGRSLGERPPGGGMAFSHEVFPLPAGANAAEVDPRDDRWVQGAPEVIFDLSRADGGRQLGERYVSRMRGSFEAPVTGEYRFALSSDDQSVLYLRRGEEWAEIAHLDSWVDAESFEGRDGQVSEPILIEAGASVALEARQVEGAGGDHLRIAVRHPDGAWERPIGAEPELAGNLPLLRRVISAVLATGEDADAAALMALAADPGVPAIARREALASLAQWLEPEPRERVQGEIRAHQPGMTPLTDRSEEGLRRAVGATLSALAARGGGELGSAAVALAVSIGVDLPLEVWRSLLESPRESGATRIAALDRLVRESGDRSSALAGALASDSIPLRIRAREWIQEPELRFAAIDTALASGPLRERQGTIASIARSDDPRAAPRLAALFESFLEGSLDSELRLDVLSAAQERAEWVGDRRLDAYRATLPEGDELAPYLVALRGGDAARGRTVFREHPVAQCSRCHIAAGDGGVAGPRLDGVGSRLDRQELLESIILPAARIAEGYEEAAAGASAMPQVQFALESSEIRDLVEFLSSLKGEGDGSP